MIPFPGARPANKPVRYVDPDAPANPVLEHGDTVMILAPHLDTWNGECLSFPQFLTQQIVSGAITIVPVSGTRFYAGQTFVYLGPRAISNTAFAYNCENSSEVALVQFVVGGKLYCMNTFTFTMLRYIKV